jgi:hypothetical protein
VLPRMIEVGPSFPCEGLPPGMECYFHLHGRMVMVRGPGILALVFYRDGRLICDCPEAQAKGECQHTRALQAGLWVYVFMCPQEYGIMTRTLDWLQREVHRPVSLLTAVPEASVTVW